jgi:dipeptidyl aminopeptidase/acylaminoacyl peptidase
MLTDTKLIPREVLFGNPEKVSPRVSPDGKRLAYIAPLDGVLNVWVGDIASGEFKPVTHDDDRGIRSYFWAHDNRHLLYIQDQGGNENWRVYDVDLDTGTTRDLTPFEGVQARVEHVDKRFPNDILIGLNKDNPQLHDIYHLDLTTGELTKRVSNPGFMAWIVDTKLQPRGALTMTPDGGFVLLVGETGDGDWKPVMQIPAEDALSTDVVGFTLDGKSLYLISSADANAGRLVKLELESGAKEVLAEDPIYDVGGAMLHPDTRELQMVFYVKDRLEYLVMDESIRTDVESIRALHPGDFGFQGRDHADKTWLVAFTADDGPVPFYAWDRDAKKATFLFEHQPALSQYTLAKMEPFSFKARDGLEVHGYVTAPPDVERRGLPTVLDVHGGPWGRDTWGFNPEAQWLANRGYLCVQVNFRGSTGYGKQFVNAGDKQWAAAMHDDLVDAVRHVVDQGWADESRVAIYGGSYGGYAALVGATFTPDVFKCAIDLCGPSSIKTLIESIPPYWAPQVALFHNRVGNPETEEEFLWSRSPLSRVDQITIPVFVAQGANDPRVKQAEAEQIVAAMKEKGIAHEYMLVADEGHGFVKPGNRLAFYAAAERFLAEHLGGRAES